MHSSTATRPSTASADSGVCAGRRIGVLGVMQGLYDAMLPGITERQAEYARELAAALGEVADVVVSPPVKDRAEVERAMRELRGRRPRRPARRHAHVRAGDERRARARRDAAAGLPREHAAGRRGDRGLGHGRPHLQPGHPRRSGHGQRDRPRRHGRSTSITGDWHSEAFVAAVGEWARAAAAVTRWRTLKVAVFGYAMNGMGDIRVDVHTLLAHARPAVSTRSRRAPSIRAAQAVERRRGSRAARGGERALRDRPALSAARSARTTPACSSGSSSVLIAGGYDAYSTHFGAIAEDGRFTRLPLAAASSLMAKGYGYAAEGDAMTAALMCAARTLFGDDAVHRDVRHGLRARRVPHEPHGRGKLGARARRPAGTADQAQPRYRRPRGPADVPLPVRDRPGDARLASGAAARPLPARRVARARSSTARSFRGSRCHTASSAPREACEPAPTPGCAPAGRTTRC